MDDYRENPNTTQETVVETRFVDTAKSYWRDFGPLIVGVLVLLVVLAGGWYLWRNRLAPSGQETVIEEQTPSGSTSQNLPEAQISLGGESPGPYASPTPSPSPSPTPKGLAEGTAGATPTTTKGGQTTKGGKQLPKTGLPLAIPALFSLGALGGIALRKLSKRI